MRWTSILAIYSLFWVLSAFLVLPFGVRTHRSHAIAAGFVAAVWIDFAYFASRTSSDTLSVLAVLPGLALLYRFRDTGSARLAWGAGFLLGLGFIARFPLGPALAIPFLWAGRGDFRKAWPALLGGASLAVFCDVLANALMGQPPLLWIMRNVFANVVENRSHAYGLETPDWYLRVLAWQWQYIAIALIPCILFGSRRYPMLAPFPPWQSSRSIRQSGTRSTASSC
jgi:phosphatidylinositol glycan class B